VAGEVVEQPPVGRIERLTRSTGREY